MAISLTDMFEKQKKMKLLDNVFEAHGGLKKWHELEKVVVHMVSSGKLSIFRAFPLIQHPGK